LSYRFDTQESSIWTNAACARGGSNAGDFDKSKKKELDYFYPAVDDNFPARRGFGKTAE